MSDLSKEEFTHIEGQTSPMPRKRGEEEQVPVGRDQLHTTLVPHVEYEGYKRWDPEFTWTPEEEKRVVRIADLKLMSVVCLMFLGLQLDRGNLSNATADNILNDLGLTTNDYNTGTTIQVVSFLCCEFPSQLILSRVGFQRWLPFLMMAWGLVSCFQAFMTDRTGFFITRALIGAFEGGFIPGAILYTSHWYTSAEMAIRLSIFWCTLNIARVLSALLAAGILTMRGVLGRTGWFWLFIIEGLFTAVVAVTAYLWLPSSPTNTKGFIWRKSWFTERQEKIMINRVLRDDPAKGLTALKSAITIQDLKDGWNDKTVWLLIFLGMIAYIPQNPVQAYFTLSLKTLGYTTLASNMLSIVPAIMQVFTMLAISWSSGYFNDRAWHVVFGELWSLPCLIAMRLLPQGGYVWARFALTSLVAGYPYFHPIVTSWISENSFSVKRRSIQVTTYNVVVQMGAVIASQLFRADDAPYYPRGIVILISICVASALVAIAAYIQIGRENSKKERIWASMSHSEQTAYQEDLAVREMEGPKRLDFRKTR